MTGIKRKNFTGELKARVALEATRGIKTVNEIGQEFGVHLRYADFHGVRSFIK